MFSSSRASQNPVKVNLLMKGNGGKEDPPGGVNVERFQ